VQDLRRHLRQITFIALFAMFGLALAPTVSHALASSGPGNPWAEICSAASGQLPVSGSNEGGPASAAGGAHLDHCPLCCQLGAAPVLPSADPAELPLLDRGDFVPALFAQSPRPLFAWAAPQSRAPPSAS
jgi:hypothetical protein